MGILDQLFDFNIEEEDESLSISPADAIVISTAQAAHQAMQDSLIGENISRSINEKLRMGVSGTVSVLKTLQLAKSYQENMVNDQLAEPGDRPTANDVIDGGIKRGQKVVFEVSSNRSINSGSWDEVVKSRMLSNTDQPIGVFFDKFSVMNFSESDSERYQIHETFGADIIQSFGRRPRLVTMSGQVLNGRVDAIRAGQVRSMDWKNAFQRFYDEHFSLKACLKKKHKIRITAQDTIWHGYLLNMVAVTDAEHQAISQVTVTFIVSSRNFRKENDIAIPGFFNENGFRITGGLVPDEFFPQERLEFYFKQDFSQVVKTKVSILNNEIEIIKQELELSAGIDRVALDSNIELSKSESNIPEIIFGETVDPYIIGSEAINGFLSIVNEKSLYDRDLSSYNDRYFNSTSDELLSPTTNPAVLEYSALKDREALLRMRSKNASDAIENLNSICRQLRQKIQESDSYTQTLAK